MLTSGSVVQFLRRRDYVFVEALGQGACGETVLLRDDIIDGLFVCKKYSPFDESLREALFNNFLREIKLLHEVYHQNVVRVFNYYLFPDKWTGYILMEYVEGQNIEDYLRAQPEMINEVFLQAIDGFSYLEAQKVLHRDIRPMNLMVRRDGIVKIIDLGFGKRVEADNDFDKSISLNWWCEPPEEFMNRIYDHTTEVYFVGKLFEKIIQDVGVKQFKFSSLLERMCKKDAIDRIASFAEVKTKINLSGAADIEFSNSERDAYRSFANALVDKIAKIDVGAKYISDLNFIRAQLELIYKGCMLDNCLHDCGKLLGVFISGQCYYKKISIPNRALKNFLDFLRRSSIEKQRIALANLHSRFDAVERYTNKTELEDDIPF